jgi:hypothetical protein
MKMEIAVEGHVERTIAKVPRDQLPTLAAGLLQRVCANDGIQVLVAMFPLVEACWEAPRPLHD